MSKHPVNAGSTREEMWDKVLNQRKELEEREVAHDLAIQKIKVIHDHAIQRHTEISKKLKTIRKILNSD